MCDPDNIAQLLAFLKTHCLGNVNPSLANKNVTSISDLVIYCIAEENINALEHSSTVVTELKKIFELWIEFIHRGGQVQQKQEPFFCRYTSIASLQIETWTQIYQSMTDQFGYEEEEVIKKIWSSNSALRRSCWN